MWMNFFSFLQLCAWVREQRGALRRDWYMCKKYFNMGFIDFEGKLLRKMECFSSTSCLHVGAMGTARYHVTLWGELGVSSDRRSPNLSEYWMQCFSSTLCFHAGAMRTLPCVVWQDVLVHLSQKEYSNKVHWVYYENRPKDKMLLYERNICLKLCVCIRVFWYVPCDALRGAWNMVWQDVAQSHGAGGQNWFQYF